MDRRNIRQAEGRDLQAHPAADGRPERRNADGRPGCPADASRAGADGPEIRQGRPEKHSLTLKGHRTSVTLEPLFWRAFREIAEAEGKGLNALASEIDAVRGQGLGLASAMRLYVLEWYRARAAGRDDRPPSYPMRASEGKVSSSQ